MQHTGRCRALRCENCPLPKALRAQARLTSPIGPKELLRRKSPSALPKGSWPCRISNFGRTNPPRSITYPETCTWYGSLTFAKVTNDKDLTARLIKRFEPLFGEESKLVPRPSNVDSTVFGSVPLEIYLEAKEQKYLDLGKSFADKQWDNPEGDARKKLKPELAGWVDKGLSWHTRFWIDDISDNNGAGPGISRHRRVQIYRSRRARNGRLPRLFTANERLVLSRARCPRFSGDEVTAGWPRYERTAFARCRPAIPNARGLSRATK